MPFGQIVIGPPGSGKSTYCHGLHQFLSALNRPCTIVNLDPANDSVPYPCDLDISELITLQDAMDAHGLGPNGAMLYCMEYLERNVDWLENELEKVLCGEKRGDEDEEDGETRRIRRDNEDENTRRKRRRKMEEGYVIFDIAGQVELSTNHDSLKVVIERLTKSGYRLAAVHLTDALHVTTASKYVSVLLLSLRTMLHLGLPHVNVLSKVDLLGGGSVLPGGGSGVAGEGGDISFNLDFYTEVQDLSHLQFLLEEEDRNRPGVGKGKGKFSHLNGVICELVEDYGLVGFETLCVEDKMSMLRLVRVIDQALGYVSPRPLSLPTEDQKAAKTSSEAHHEHSHLPPVGADPSDLLFTREVQEKWVDYRDEWEDWERKKWKEEGERERMKDEKDKETSTGGNDASES